MKEFCGLSYYLKKEKRNRIKAYKCNVNVLFYSNGYTKDPVFIQDSASIFIIMLFHLAISQDQMIVLDWL